MRWTNYVLARDSFGLISVEQLWRAASHSRTTYYILGLGFDPRATVGLQRFLALGIPDSRVISVGLRPQAADDTTKGQAERNERILAELEAKHPQAFLRVGLPAVEEPRSAGLRLARELLQQGRLSTSASVIVDISSLPSSVHFPLIGVLLSRAAKEPFELQVVACENPQLDDAVLEQGVVDAGPIGGFKDGLDLEAGSRQLRIWAPVLGHGRDAAMRSILARLDPEEVYPVLPFPARNPRRGDDLLSEYREMLFDTAQIEPRNIIYAAESDPFDLYRTLSTLYERMGRTLAPIGAPVLVLSTHSSKLLSIGVLLAAFEHNLPVMTATPSQYAIDPSIGVEEISAENSLTCVWLAGTPYERAAAT
jgi:hypothetical protein